MGHEIPKLKVVDLGDVEIVDSDIDNNLKEIKKFVREIYSQKKDIIPVMIGGDHFCSYPVVKVFFERYQDTSDIGVLIFDAHLDLYNEWDKGIYSHATVTHRIYDLKEIADKNLLIVGTRDVDIPEKKIAEIEKISYIPAFELSEVGLEEFTNKIIKYFSDSNVKKLYVSIDIDIFDPSVAPGTGFPIPGGLTYREMWKILKEIAKKFEVLAFDLVEVAPNLDIANNLTSNLAAKLIIEFISFISERKSI